MDRQETLAEIKRLSQLAVDQMKKSGMTYLGAKRDTPTMPPSLVSRTIQRAIDTGVDFSSLSTHGLLLVDPETLSIIRLRYNGSTEEGSVIVKADMEHGLTVQINSDYVPMGREVDVKVEDAPSFT